MYTSPLALPLTKKIVIGTLSVGLGFLSVGIATRLMFVRSSVMNVSDRAFFSAQRPDGFIQQRSDNPDLGRFRASISPYTKGAGDLATAIYVRHWVHQQQPQGISWTPHTITLMERIQGDFDDPFLLLKSVRGGAPATCRNFSFLLVAASESVGLTARTVLVTPTYWKNHDHVMAEIWISSLNKWVLMDAMWDLMYEVAGTPASTLDVYGAAQKGTSNQIQLVKENSRITADGERTRLQFAQVYVALSNALFDGYGVRLLGGRRMSFAHLVTESSPPFPNDAQSVAMGAGLLLLLSGILILVQTQLQGVKILFQRDVKRRCPASGEMEYGT